MLLAAGWDYFYNLFSLAKVRQGLKSLSHSESPLKEDWGLFFFSENPIRKFTLFCGTGILPVLKNGAGKMPTPQ